jgi:hypothetical protein
LGCRRASEILDFAEFTGEENDLIPTSEEANERLLKIGLSFMKDLVNLI